MPDYDDSQGQRSGSPAKKDTPKTSEHQGATAPYAQVKEGLTHRDHASEAQSHVSKQSQVAKDHGVNS